MPHDANYMAVVSMAEQLQREVTRLKAHANTTPVTVQPSHADVTALVLRCEGLERERDQARELARRLFAHNQELMRDMLTAHPATDVQELMRDRDHWRAECRREHTLVEHADAGNASLRQENEHLRAEVERLNAVRSAVRVGDDDAQVVVCQTCQG